jgi:hypothetical protein
VRASAANVVDMAHRLEAVEGRLAELEAENKWLRQCAGRTRALAMTAIVGLAQVKDHVGLPQRKPPGGSPLKMVAFDSGWSESGLRKVAEAAEAAGRPIGEKTGGKWLIDIAKLRPKRKYKRPGK